MLDKFFMLYVEGKTGSTVRHLDPEKAWQEAERLARKEKRKVFVLESKEYCEVAEIPVTWYKL